MTFLLAAALAVLTLLFPSEARSGAAEVQVALPAVEAPSIDELIGTWTATFDNAADDGPIATAFEIERMDATAASPNDALQLRASGDEIVEIQHAFDGDVLVFAANSLADEGHRPHPTQLTGRLQGGVLTGTLYSPELRALVTWRATRTA